MTFSPRILIIEDEPNVRLVFRAALLSETYVLSIAEDGEMGLRYHRQSPSDLILMDLGMPGPDGLEILKKLREDGDHVPVVIVTANDAASKVEEAMKLGASAFLTKPTTPEALRNIVADVLKASPDGRPVPKKNLVPSTQSTSR